MTRIEPKQSLEAVLFDATTPIAGGFLRFNEKFQLIQVDVDGAGIKIKNLARSLVTMRGADKFAEEPRAGVPALRSAGIMLVEHDRGQKLKDALGRSGDHKAAEAVGICAHRFDNSNEDITRDLRTFAHDPLCQPGLRHVPPDN